MTEPMHEPPSLPIRSSGYVLPIESGGISIRFDVDMTHLQNQIDQLIGSRSQADVELLWSSITRPISFPRRSTQQWSLAEVVLRTNPDAEPSSAAEHGTAAEHGAAVAHDTWPAARPASNPAARPASNPAARPVLNPTARPAILIGSTSHPPFPPRFPRYNPYDRPNGFFPTPPPSPRLPNTIDQLSRFNAKPGIVRSKCTICLVDIVEDEVLVMLFCNHYFHERCISGWFQEHRNCPSCRRDQIHRPIYNGQYDQWRFDQYNDALVVTDAEQYLEALRRNR